MNREGDLRARNLRTLGILGGLFLLPLVLAFWMYYGTDWRPAARVNHGELIIPPHPLPSSHLEPALHGGSVPAQLFRQRWSLVYIGDGQCDAACRQALYVMRQTRLALNNEMTRVERLFLVTSGCCASDFLQREHPGLFVLEAADPSGRELTSIFPTDGRNTSLFIVDPLGNLMMRFDVRQNPKGLREDLKKLLTLSHIG